MLEAIFIEKGYAGGAIEAACNPTRKKAISGWR